MEVAELDIAIDELETRVDRLRALYEQYFMGIEKMPPYVVQKDVDRRMYVLRREQIRNTARRFKLQTIIQRYNTFQQYWMRIMREIENGTYKRHVLRAERTIGVAGLLTPGERKRLGLPDVEQKRSDTSQQSLAPDLVEPHATEDAPTTTRSPSTLPEHPSTTPAAIRSQIERELGFLLDENDELLALQKFDLGKDLDDPLLSTLPPAPRKKKPSIRTSRHYAEPPSTGRRSNGPIRSSRAPDSERTERGLGPTTPRQFGSSRTTDGENLRPPNAASDKAHPLPSPELTSGRHTLSGTALPPHGLRLPARSAVAGRGLPPPPLKNAPVARGNTPQSLSAPLPPLLTRKLPESADTTSPPRGLPNIHDSVPPYSTRPPSATRRPLASSTAKPPLPVALPRRLAPSTAKPPLPLHTASPQLRNVPESQLRSSETTGIDRTKLEHLAEKLRQARQQTHESASVSTDALAKKLETTKIELQKRHIGKQIDFDVVIKDGKAIVKPIVR